jgi:AcrR family transcriptional regulator
MATQRPRLEGSPRERLLAAANELFYDEGVHTVGIDRVIERAGVAKASLYSTFGSKDALVSAYLEGRADARRARIAAWIAKHTAPRAKLLSIFDLLAEISARPDFRGCAFVNASAEGPHGAGRIDEVSIEQRAWLRELFVDLARDAGAADPERVGRRIALLYDGAMVGAWMDRDPGVARDARAVAAELLDEAIEAKSRRR